MPVLGTIQQPGVVVFPAEVATMTLSIHRAFPFLLLCLLGGCLVSANSKQKVTGNYVPESTFEKIEPGKTTAAWVQATLGEPSSKDKVEGGRTEVWKYSYTEEKESSGAVFLLFGGSDRKEQKRIAYVELKDGIVTRKWRG
jgi:outer membrane protein assembly factor BamE (lipoprotein component of BamABCDE complex)